MTRSKLQFNFAALCLILFLAGGEAAYAAERAEKPPAAKKAKAEKKVSKASGTKIILLPHSGENPAQRSSRLKRECKGRVNAGACEGYTS